MKAKLIVVGGDAKAAEINLKLPTIIGRGREAPLMLPHPLVSRQHCEIFEQNGQLVVRDLGSLNGTFINNERITEAVLPNGELLTIGTVTFRAVYNDKGAARPPAAKPPPARQAGRGEKTVGQPSDPTVDVQSPASGPSHPTVAQPPKAGKSKVKIPVATPAAATSEAAGKSGRGSKVGKGTKIGKGQAAPEKTAPFTAAKDVTLQVPPAASGPPPKRKAWAESADDVEPIEFTDDDDFELGEDESLTPPIATEFTTQTARPPGFGKRKAEDASDEEELEFGAAPPPLKPAEPVKSKEKTKIPGGELTTNFDAKKLAEEKAKAKAAQDKKKEGDAPSDEPKKGNLSTDEDLEAFFKSLG